ncbi:hypothetical protein A0H81_10100 [Grifola frondosa]|uniref:Uncharacterized protein n=1 Tax=Grifola frondosa TaxID=5627 RepID=A0A1C7LY41_GRIFR|nr:hypothetical protein A0H81_10100 [Grifola frondosa]
MRDIVTWNECEDWDFPRQAGSCLAAAMARCHGTSDVLEVLRILIIDKKQFHQTQRPESVDLLRPTFVCVLAQDIGL